MLILSSCPFLSLLLSNSDASAAGGGGTTSVRAMVAQFDSVATDLEATKTSVNDELTRVTEDVDKRLNAQKQTLDDEIATITAGVEDKLTTAATETDQKIGTVQGDLKTGLEAVTDSITTVVKPQIDEVKAIVGDILKALLGSNSGTCPESHARRGVCVRTLGCVFMGRNSHTHADLVRREFPGTEGGEEGRRRPPPHPRSRKCIK